MPHYFCCREMQEHLYIGTSSEIMSLNMMLWYLVAWLSGPAGSPTETLLRLLLGYTWPVLHGRAAMALQPAKPCCAGQYSFLRPLLPPLTTPAGCPTRAIGTPGILSVPGFIVTTHKFCSRFKVPDSFTANPALGPAHSPLVRGQTKYYYQEYITKLSRYR